MSTPTARAPDIDGEQVWLRLVQTAGAALMPLKKRRSSPLFRAGGRPALLYHVVRGEVRLQRTTASGEPVLLQRVERGFVAEPSLTSPTYYCDGVCHADTELVGIPIPVMRRAIDDDAQLRWHWIAMLGSQARRHKARAERLQLKTVRERLLHLVLTEGGADGRYALPGTRLALAQELGVSPEAMYRALAALRRDGTLSVDDAGIHWRL